MLGVLQWWTHGEECIQFISVTEKKIHQSSLCLPARRVRRGLVLGLTPPPPRVLFMCMFYVCFFGKTPLLILNPPPPLKKILRTPLLPAV